MDCVGTNKPDSSRNDSTNPFQFRGAAIDIEYVKTWIERLVSKTETVALLRFHYVSEKVLFFFNLNGETDFCLLSAAAEFSNVLLDSRVSEPFVWGDILRGFSSMEFALRLPSAGETPIVFLINYVHLLYAHKRLTREEFDNWRGELNDRLQPDESDELDSDEPEDDSSE